MKCRSHAEPPSAAKPAPKPAEPAAGRAEGGRRPSRRSAQTSCRRQGSRGRSPSPRRPSRPRSTPRRRSRPSRRHPRPRNPLRLRSRRRQIRPQLKRSKSSEAPKPGAAKGGKNVDDQIAAAVQRRAAQVAEAPACRQADRGGRPATRAAGTTGRRRRERRGPVVRSPWGRAAASAGPPPTCSTSSTRAAWRSGSRPPGRGPARTSTLQAVVQFNLTPEGEIRNVHTIQSSGDRQYDASCERAVRAVTPLEAVPEKYRKEFATVEMTFKPSDMGDSCERWLWLCNRVACDRAADALHRPSLRAPVLAAVLVVALRGARERKCARPSSGPACKRYPIASRRSRIRRRTRDQFAACARPRSRALGTVPRHSARHLHRGAPRRSGVTAESINFDNWSVIGALALVKGTVERQGDDLTIEARLFDVTQRKQLAGRRFRGRAADEPRMANRFADEIIQYFTGERGPFDSQIAFLSTRGGRFKDVYVMSANGDGVRRITNENTINLSPSWTPDGRGLVLTSFRGRNPDLFSISLARRAWTQAVGAARPEPRRALVARRSPTCGDARVRRQFRDIALLNADGSLQKRLTDHWAVDVSPTWSPDGQQLAFCSDRSGAPQIYVMSADGGGVRRVTTSGNYNTSPSWSPKGDRIAYASRVGGPLPDLHGEDRRHRRPAGHAAAPAATRTRAGRPTVAISSSARRAAARRSSTWRCGWCEPSRIDGGKWQ